jgi:undecaprenyl-diphosphatase
VNAIVCILLMLVYAAAHAQSPSNVDRNRGFLGIDRFDENEARGIYSRPNQQRVDTLVIAGMVGTALWQGSTTPLGKAVWESMDASLTSGLTAEAMKRVFARPRPSQDSDPRVWFDGNGHRSFPSAETALMTAFATPLILSFHDEHPAVWGLAALPLYMGKARMASQGHWLTDVLGGAALGFTMGYYAHQREQPLVLRLTGDGVYVGLKARF